MLHAASVEKLGVMALELSAEDEIVCVVEIAFQDRDTASSENARASPLGGYQSRKPEIAAEKIPKLEQRSGVRP